MEHRGLLTQNTIVWLRRCRRFCPSATGRLSYLTIAWREETLARRNARTKFDSSDGAKYVRAGHNIVTTDMPNPNTTPAEYAGAVGLAPAKPEGCHNRLFTLQASCGRGRERHELWAQHRQTSTQSHHRLTHSCPRIFEISRVCVWME